MSLQQNCSIGFSPRIHDLLSHRSLATLLVLGMGSISWIRAQRQAESSQLLPQHCATVAAGGIYCQASHVLSCKFHSWVRAEGMDVPNVRCMVWRIRSPNIHSARVLIIDKREDVGLGTLELCRNHKSTGDILCQVPRRTESISLHLGPCQRNHRTLQTSGQQETSAQKTSS